MKKWICVSIGLIMLAVQITTLYLICDVNSKGKLNNDYIYKEDSQDNSISVEGFESPIMDLQQAATYIGVTPKQLQKMIDMEAKELNSTGSYTGEMIPYFKVDNDILFYKNRVDVWLEDVVIRKTEYNTVNAYILD